MTGARLALAAAALLLRGNAAALDAGLSPARLQTEVAFEQTPGARVPAEARFRDGAAAPAPLSAWLGRRPAIVVPVYFRCPMLCPLSLEGLMKALRVLPLSVGRDFEVIVYSIDPRDGPAQAEAKRRELVAAYRRPGSEAGWHVLTGGAAPVAALSASLGFRAVRDAAAGQYAHAPGAVVVAPDGRAARWFLGLDYSARDLRLALVEASRGRLGRWTDQALLLCFRYDESASRYTPAILRLLRAAAALTAVLLLGALAWARRREGRA